MKFLVNFVLVLIAILVRDSTARPGHLPDIIHESYRPTPQLFPRPLYNFPKQFYLHFQEQMHTQSVELGEPYVIPSPQGPSYQDLQNIGIANSGNTHIAPVNPQPWYSIPRNPETSYLPTVNPVAGHSGSANSIVTKPGIIYPEKTNAAQTNPVQNKLVPGKNYIPLYLNGGVTEHIGHNNGSQGGMTVGVISKKPESGNTVHASFNTGGVTGHASNGNGSQGGITIGVISKKPESENTVHAHFNTSGLTGHTGTGNGSQGGISIGVISKKPESGNTVHVSFNTGGVTGHTGNNNGPQRDIFIAVPSIGQRSDVPLNSTTRGQETPSAKH